MVRIFLFTLLYIIGVLLSQSARAQDIIIKLGPDEIGANQIFTISIIVKNDRIKSYNDFPEIDGFIKRGTSSSSSTNIINGQITTTQSVTMNYVPQNEGTFTLPPFTMEVNEKKDPFGR